MYRCICIYNYIYIYICTRTFFVVPQLLTSQQEWRAKRRGNIEVLAPDGKENWKVATAFVPMVRKRNCPAHMLGIF